MAAPSRREPALRSRSLRGTREDEQSHWRWIMAAVDLVQHDSFFESADASAWVVRAGPEGETVEHNLETGVVTIGWDEWPAPARGRFEDRAAFGVYLDGEFSDREASSRQSARDQIWRFYHEVSIGDLVVLPLKNHGTDDDWIAIGRVTGVATLDESQPKDCLHHRRVRWLASTVPKSAAPEPLQGSIDKTRRTVYGLNRGDKARWVQDLVDEFFDAAPDDTQDGDTDGSDRAPRPLSGDEAGVYDEHGEVVEGATTKATVLRYERDAEARRICVKVHGARCSVCGLDFGDAYGGFAQGFIHVHHKTPVAQAAQDGQYRLNPRTDLVPVCPNCHAMLHHHTDKPCTVEKLKLLMERAAE